MLGWCQSPRDIVDRCAGGVGSRAEKTETDRSVSVSATGYPELTSLRLPLRWDSRGDHNESSHCHASGTVTISLSVAVRMWYPIHLYSSGFCKWHATGRKTGLVVETLRTGARKLFTMGFGSGGSVGRPSLGRSAYRQLEVEGGSSRQAIICLVVSFLGCE